MTEAHSNPDLVAFHRQSELEKSQREYQIQREQKETESDATGTGTDLSETPVAIETVPSGRQADPSDPATALQTFRLSAVALVALVLLLVYCIRKRHDPGSRGSTAAY